MNILQFNGVKFWNNWKHCKSIFIRCSPQKQFKFKYKKFKVISAKSGVEHPLCAPHSDLATRLIDLDQHYNQKYMYINILKWAHKNVKARVKHEHYTSKDKQKNIMWQLTISKSIAWSH